MKKRNPIAVFLFGLITLGLYSWYWAVKTKGEMNKLGEKVPTAWIWLIPIVGSIWWYWKYSEAVENVTHKELNKVLAFVVLYLLGSIGQAIIQDYFNKLVAAPAPAAAGPAFTTTNPVTQQPVSPVEQPVVPVTVGMAAPALPTDVVPPAVPPAPAQEVVLPPEQQPPAPIPPAPTPPGVPPVVSG
jgi:hypothetical protein